MKVQEELRLALSGVERISKIVSNENHSLLNYGWFETTLEEKFGHDSKAGGVFLCRVVDLAKENFPYREEGGKQVNPLKNVVRGLTLRFNAIYSESLGSKYRLATHKSKPTRLVPVKGRASHLTKEERAIKIVQNLVGRGVDIMGMVCDHAHTLALEIEFQRTELAGIRAGQEEARKKEITAKAVALAKSRDLLVSGKSSKAKNDGIVNAIAVGLGL